MAEHSKIEWTHHTHNEWLGCTRISPGCKNCYASALMKRHGRIPEGYVAGSPRILTSEANRRKPFTWDRAAAKAGERRRVFAQSLSDVFDEEVSDEWRDTLFARMALTPNLDWLVLTKRAQRMHAYLSDQATADRVRAAAVRLNPGQWTRVQRRNADRALLLPNVRLGLSVEDQARANERLPALVKLGELGWATMASVEPLLGPVDISPWLYSGFTEPPQTDIIQWVIVGGESGNGDIRPCDVAWIRSVRDQCAAARVPCFVKQLGAHPYEEMLPIEQLGTDGALASFSDGDAVRRRLASIPAGWCLTHAPDGKSRLIRELRLRDRKGGDPSEWPEDLRVRAFPHATVGAAS